jgi:hypothetical protein
MNYSTMPASELPIAELADFLRLRGTDSGFVRQDPQLELSMKASLSEIEASIGVVLIDASSEEAMSENWEGLPSDLKMAVLILAAGFYNQRDNFEGQVSALPKIVQGLIQKHRTLKIFKGVQP